MKTLLPARLSTPEYTVFPGFCDVHVHFREPGFSYKEAMEAGSAAAAAGSGMRLYQLLGLDALDVSVALIKNVPSRKMGRKDIIKIDADILVSIDVIGCANPETTVNVIRSGVLTEKKTLAMPELLTGVISCKNPRCITTSEQGLKSVFRLTDPKNKTYRCIYCETKAQ